MAKKVPFAVLSPGNLRESYARSPLRALSSLLCLAVILCSCTVQPPPKPESNCPEDVAAYAVLKRLRGVEMERDTPLCQEPVACRPSAQIAAVPWISHLPLLKALGVFSASYTPARCERHHPSRLWCSSQQDRAFTLYLNWQSHFRKPPSANLDAQLAADALLTGDLLALIGELSTLSGKLTPASSYSPPQYCTGGQGTQLLRNFAAEFGVPFVREVRTRGGTQGLRALLRAPPATTKAIVARTPDPAHSLPTPPGARLGPLVMYALLHNYFPAPFSQDRLLGYLEDSIEYPDGKQYLWQSIWNSPKAAEQFMESLCDILELRFGVLTPTNSYQHCELTTSEQQLMSIRRPSPTTVAVHGQLNLHRELGRLYSPEALQQLPLAELPQT